ncbi:MAG: hypothetical protein ACI9VN_003273, partial [Patescibacteria group bacterium]
MNMNTKKHLILTLFSLALFPNFISGQIPLGSTANIVSGCQVILGPSATDACCLEEGTTFCWTSNPPPVGGTTSTTLSSERNITVSPTVTTTYTLTIKKPTTVEPIIGSVLVNVMPGGNAVVIDVFKPISLGGDGVTPLPDNDDAMAFVNVDNDDMDGDFDYEDMVITGGDDDFIKIRLKVNAAIAGGVPPTIKLDAIDNSNDDFVSMQNYAKFWQSADKSTGEYILGDDLVLSNLSGGFYTKDLWVEGTYRHTAQRHTRLVMEYSGATCEATEEMALTILGVRFFEWSVSPQGNGFAPPNHGSVNLDNDPQFPVGQTNENGSPLTCFRVFPGARLPGDINAPRDIVNARVHLWVEPLEPVEMYVKAFDMDDPYQYLPPSAPENFIDPNDDLAIGGIGTYSGTAIGYTSSEDNRGTVVGGGKYGAFPDDVGDEIIAIEFSQDADPLAPSVLAIVRFKVSQSPGDNFRLAVSIDQDFLGQLKNVDRHHGFKVVDEDTNGNPDLQKEIPFAEEYMTPILTVWRILHLESDSMEPYVQAGSTQQKEVRINDFASVIVPNMPPPAPLPMPTPNAQGNNVLTFFTQQDLVNNTSPQPFRDNSPNLYNPGVALANGRFEMGTLTLGIGAGAVVIPGIVGNGFRRIELNAPIDLNGLPCALTTLGGIVLNTTIASVDKINPADYTWTIDLPVGVNIMDYNGGTINVASGGNTNIDVPLGSVNTVNTTQFRLRTKVVDDDAVPATLPHHSSLTEMNVFNRAYLLPVLDGGGIMANNDNDIQFVENLFILEDPVIANVQLNDIKMNRESAESDFFWVSHLTSCWQSDNELDGDPNAEGKLHGILDVWPDTGVPRVHDTDLFI